MSHHTLLKAVYKKTQAILLLPVVLIRDRWLNMNKEVACRKIMKITNKIHIQNVGKYLDTVKNKWFSKVEDMYL